MPTPGSQCAAAALSMSMFGTLLAAQTGAVVPAALNGVEGGSGSSIPFGTNQAVRYQCIYDAAELPWSGPRTFSAISLRADNSVAGAIAQKGFVVVTVLMSTTAVTAASASTRFADNWGPDAMYVINAIPMMLPAQPAVAGVRPCNIDFVFQTPWAYGLLPARPGGAAQPNNLLIEIEISSQPAGAYRIDNIGNCQSQQVEFGNQGPLCAAAGLAPLALVPGASMQAGSAFTWTIRNAEPSAPIIVGVDLTSTGTFVGLPLPVALFDPAGPMLPPPGLAAVFRFGAPDCWVNVSPVVVLTAVADATGVAVATTTIGGSRLLVGQSFCAQALAYSQTANALLLTTTKGEQTTVCGPLGVARIYAFGSALATTGQVGVGQGAIFEAR